MDSYRIRGNLVRVLHVSARNQRTARSLDPRSFKRPWGIIREAIGSARIQCEKRKSLNIFLWVSGVDMTEGWDQEATVGSGEIPEARGFGRGFVELCQDCVRFRGSSAKIV